MKPFIARRGQTNQEFEEGSPPESYMVIGFVNDLGTIRPVRAVCVGTDGRMTSVPIEELYVTGLNVEMPLDFIKESPLDLVLSR